MTASAAARRVGGAIARPISAWVSSSVTWMRRMPNMVARPSSKTRIRTRATATGKEPERIRTKPGESERPCTARRCACTDDLPARARRAWRGTFAAARGG